MSETSHLQFIIMEVKDAADIPNHDVGYWADENAGVRVVHTAKLGNVDYEFLVLLHEMIEQHLCVRDGVSAAAVDAWDAEHWDAPDGPGALPDAPYHRQHGRAEMVEMAAASLLGVDWQQYDEEIARKCYGVSE